MLDLCEGSLHWDCSPVDPSPQLDGPVCLGTTWLCGFPASGHQIVLSKPRTLVDPGVSELDQDSSFSLEAPDQDILLGEPVVFADPVVFMLYQDPWFPPICVAVPKKVIPRAEPIVVGCVFSEFDQHGLQAFECFVKHFRPGDPVLDVTSDTEAPLSMVDLDIRRLKKTDTDPPDKYDVLLLSGWAVDGPRLPNASELHILEPVMNPSVLQNLRSRVVVTEDISNDVTVVMYKCSVMGFSDRLWQKMSRYGTESVFWKRFKHFDQDTSPDFLAFRACDEMQKNIRGLEKDLPRVSHFADQHYDMVWNSHEYQTQHIEFHDNDANTCRICGSHAGHMINELDAYGASHLVHDVGYPEGPRADVPPPSS